MEMLGYIGAGLLAICAFPQMLKSIIDGHARGVSHLFLWFWYLGEIFMTIFCYSSLPITSPLMLNYIANTIMLTVIVKYKYLERK